jgi:5-carboxymethyl-2-hydroxymuconate isomerase
MPHLTLEYTNNLRLFDAAKALRDLNGALIESKLFEEADIKSRALSLDTFLVGASPDPRGFIHVRLAILSGRSEQAKRDLSASLLHALKARCEPMAGGEIQLSVEIQDIERGSYAKATLTAG